MHALGGGAMLKTILGGLSLAAVMATLAACSMTAAGPRRTRRRNRDVHRERHRLHGRGRNAPTH